MRRFKNKSLAGIALSAALAASMLGGCTGSTVNSTDTGTAASKTEVPPSESEFTGKEGAYTGTAKGYGGDVTVTVSIDEFGTVIGFSTLAEAETPEIGGKAAEQLTEAIMANQSLAVDAIAGATITSNGVIEAAKAALTEAGIDAEAWENKAIAKAAGEDETVSVDIVVVGAGGSGTAAALAATEWGARVMVLEKLGTVGGNTRLASGFFAIDSKWQREKGLELDVDVAVNRLLEFNNYLSNGPLTRAIVEKSSDTLEWLEAYGMEFYLQQETTQFAHENDPYEYKCYHKYIDSSAGFEALYEKLDQMGTEVRLNTAFSRLLQDANGKVTGIEAVKPDGGSLTVNANAVIMCTGGFGGDQERSNRLLNTEYATSIGMPNMGEGYHAMVDAGAIDLDGTPLLHACQLAEAEITTVSSSETLAGFSESSLTQLLMSPLLWVDASGSRFVNEDVVYDTAFWANAAVAAGGRYYIIADETTLNAYTNGDTLRISKSGPSACMDPADFVELADAAVEAGTAWKASGVEELAELTGMSAADLQKSVERYNAMVESGTDTDYNKAAASLKFTAAEGSLYAFDCRAVYLGTIGGVKVDEYLQVIDGDYNPIPGLYAAGTNAGGYYNGLGYPPYEGLACGFAWTSGRIAGESAVQYIK